MVCLDLLIGEPGYICQHASRFHFYVGWWHTSKHFVFAAHLDLYIATGLSLAGVTTL